MFRRLRSLAVVFASALILSMAVPAPPAYSGYEEERNPHFYTLRRGSGGFHHYVTSVSRTRSFSRVTGKPVFGRPAVSRDGTWVVFSGVEGDGSLGIYRLYVMNANGSGRRRITHVVGADLDPAWAPNGKRIAFSRDASGSLRPATCCSIWTVGANGKGHRRVPNTRGGVNPSWKPNGKRIVFETPSGLFTISPGGGNRNKIAGGAASDPAWSPSGNHIAFVRRVSSGTDELVVHNLNNGSKKVWYRPGAHIESPTWSGNSIYVVTYTGRGYDGRNASRLRVVRGPGRNSVVLDPPGEMVFASQSINPCYGAAVSGGLTGGPRIAGLAATGDCFSRGLAAGDFDNNGRDDASIGVPGDREAGAVNVIYGRSGGLSAAGDRIFFQGRNGIPGASENDDRFGYAVATGDFDNDGFEDLAVGAPGEGINGNRSAGLISVIYGSGAGLRPSSGRNFSQASPGVPGSPQSGDRFGEALAVGDFDNDGFDDLAVGVPGENVNGTRDSGAINVLYGSGSGLRGAGARVFSQASSGVPGSLQVGDRFGESLAAGQLDGGGTDDLAVGIPGQNVNGKRDAGAINVMYGSGSGLRGAGAQTFTQASSGVPGSPQLGDRFGMSLAVGRLNGGAIGDLVVGVPGENVNGQRDAGAVNVLYGSGSGLRGAGARMFSQRMPGVPGGAESGDRFGEAVATGRFNGGAHWDVAIGVPGEGVNGRRDAGAVNVLYGSGQGLRTAGARVFSQATGGVAEGADRGDQFGKVLAAGRLDAGATHDLIVGVPGESFNGKVDAGKVNVLYGSSSGLRTAGSDLFSQDG